MQVVIDASQLTVLVRQQTRAVATVDRETQKSVMVEALSLKRSWQAEAAGHRRLQHLPAAVVVDRLPGATLVSFGDGSQGALAGIATFGSPTSGPVMNPFQHSAAAEVRLSAFVARIGADLLDGAL